MKRAWKILDYGDVPENTRLVSYTCAGCGSESGLPVVGLPVAQIDGGIVFDPGKHAMPRKIQCRRCRRTFEVS
jgi:hypothetical protein